MPKGGIALRIKELFTVPEGTRITEKMFGKVLLSSICSILLCMVCLVSTTWAWFTVSIDNKGNEIRIATVTPIVEIKAGNTVVSPVDDTGYTLNEGIYTIGVRLENDATGSDDLNRPRGIVYVVMIVTYGDTSESYFFALDGNQVERKELQISGGTAVVNFSVSWVEPTSATPVGSEAVAIGENPAEPST